MHSSWNPDQLCGSNLAVGEEDVKIDTKVTETSSVLKTDLEQENMQKRGFFSPQSPVLQKNRCCTQDQMEPAAEPLLFPSTLEIALCSKNSQWASGCCCAPQMDTGISRARYLQGFRWTSAFSCIPNLTPFEVNENSHKFRWDLRHMINYNFYSARKTEQCKRNNIIYS